MLSKKDQDDFIEEMRRNRTIDQFRITLQAIKESLEKSQGKDNKDEGSGNESDKNLQSEIQKAIQCIEAELNKEPKISWGQNSQFEKN